MRIEVHEVVGGKLYDTEKAVVIASDEYWDGHNYERCGRNVHLYKTAKGSYFKVTSTQWQGELDRIQPLTVAEAKQLYEEMPEHDVEYVEAFGEEPEEA